MPTTIPAAANDSPSRRTMLTGLATAMATPVIAATAATLPSPDPTFALIERHRAAYAAFNEALRSPDVEEAPVESDAERAAMEALLMPEPTTLAGLRALALYMVAYGKLMDDFQTAQWALATLAEACRLLIPAPIDGVA